tara:strand:- start:2141 stop:3364 length:1224 start_codon:yes stop_codon:yes gene_type:complete
MIFNNTNFNNKWGIYELSSLGSFSRGKSKHRPRNDEKLFDNGVYPLIQTGDVKKSNLYINNNSSYYNDFGLSQSKIWDKGTLCITIAANIAETSILSYPMCFPDSIVGFSADKEKTSEIFMHYIFTYIRRSIQNSVSGSIQDNINIDYLSNLKFRIPNLDYQNKVVGILASIDKKIEINNKINAELEAMAKTIYDYWFIQFDFPDENGKPYKSSGGNMVYNEALKREIPEGWSSDYLGNICDLYQSKTISDKEMSDSGKFLVYGANGIIGKYDDYNHSDSEIIISCRGSCGDIRRTLPRVWITGNAMVVKPKSKILHNEFIYHTLKIIGIHKSITGSVQKQITRANLEKLSMLVPENTILIKYIDIVRDIVEKKLNNIQENIELEELRDWLLPMLMNGQVGFKSLGK